MINIIIILFILKFFISQSLLAMIIVSQNRIIKNNIKTNNKILKKILKNDFDVINTLKYFNILIDMFNYIYISIYIFDSVRDFRFDFYQIVLFFILMFLISIFLYFIYYKIPDSISKIKPIFLVKKLKYLIYTIYVVFSWLTKIVSSIDKKILKILNLKNEITQGDYTEKEIRIIVDESAKMGSIDKKEIEMINNVFEFDNKIAGEVVTHRKDIVAINADSSYEELVKIIIGEKYSRIPVYEENIDNIIGILHIKDILQIFIKNEFQENRNLDLRKFIRKPYFLPFTKKIADLFQEMKKNKIYLVVIVDEYGGTFGIVTIEDLIEEIMGSILDEYDEDEKPEIEKINDFKYIIKGTAPLGEVFDCLGIEDRQDDYDTIGGFIISKIGHIPSENKRHVIKFDDYFFKVNSIKENRIMFITAYKRK